MPKPKRGRLIKKIKDWRGVCPSCKKTGVKLLWEKPDEAGKSMKVCKRCGA